MKKRLLEPRLLAGVSAPISPGREPNRGARRSGAGVGALGLAALLLGGTTLLRAAEPAPITVTGLGLSLVPIRAGTFTMGHPAGQFENDSDEGPETRVTFSKPFWLGATEVTVGQWREFVTATGYRTEAELDGGLWIWIGPGSIFEKRAGTDWRNPGGGLRQADTHPVVGVSWNDAMRFCTWLTERERAAGRVPAGYAYTLPTEAQWEYSARAGTAGPEAKNLDDMAWYAANSGMQTHPVGTKKPNAWGLYDTHGNVWEWCLDWYGPYPGGSVTDPKGPAKGTVRENRGGAWNSVPGHGISSFNRWDQQGIPRRNNLGFRLALSPER